MGCKTRALTCKGFPNLTCNEKNAVMFKENPDQIYASHTASTCDDVMITTTEKDKIRCVISFTPTGHVTSERKIMEDFTFKDKWGKTLTLISLSVIVLLMPIKTFWCLLVIKEKYILHPRNLVY